MTSTPIYRVPWGRPERPEIIQTPYGRLFVGTAFTLTNDGRYIDFMVSPEVFMQDGYIHVEKASEPAFSMAHKLLGMEPMYGPLDPVIRYLGTDPSDIQIKKAFAVFAGAALLDSPTRIDKVRPFLDGYVYSGNGIEVPVLYPHTKVATGRVYPEGYVFGKRLQLYPDQDNPSAEWWGTMDPEHRQENFSDYVELIDFFPIKGRVVLPNFPAPAWSIYSDFPGDPDRTHIRFTVYPDRETDDLFWQYVWKNETQTGRYLNTIARLPAPPAPRDSIPDTPACWDEVVKLHETTRYFEVIFNLEATYPDLEAIPESLTRLVNPVDLLFRTGFAEHVQWVRMDYKDVQQRIYNLGIFLKASKPTDRFRRVELLRDPEELVDGPLLSESSYNVFFMEQVALNPPDYNWEYTPLGAITPRLFYGPDVDPFPLLFEYTDETMSTIMPVDITLLGLPPEPDEEFIWKISGSNIYPEHYPLLTTRVEIQRYFYSETEVESTSVFEIEQN